MIPEPFVDEELKNQRFSILAEIIKEKNVDCSNNENYANFRFEHIDPGYQFVGAMDSEIFCPPVVLTIANILKHHEIDCKKKTVGILGRDSVIGQFAQTFFKKLEAKVDAIENFDKNDQKHLDRLKRCDIVVSAVNRPELFDARHLKQGAMVIDTGMSKNSCELTCAYKYEKEWDESGEIKYTSPSGFETIYHASLLNNLYKCA